MTSDYRQKTCFFAVCIYCVQILNDAIDQNNYDSPRRYTSICNSSSSVVKSKQCLSSGQDGLVLVQSGGKKYMGFVFETDNFQGCSTAADLLTQKQQEDNESDYERGKENESSQDINLNVSDMKNVTTPIRVKGGGDRGRIAKGWQRTRNGHCPTSNDDAHTINTASTTTAFTSCTDPKAMPLSSPTTDSNLILALKNTKIKFYFKYQLQGGDDTSSPDTQPDEDNFIKLIEPIKMPTFNGSRLARVVTTDSTINRSMDKDSCSQSMEQNYFMPLLIGQERLEMKMESLYNNQMKIQKRFKQKTNLQGKIFSYFPKDDLFTKLIISRRNLGIFQHHDAITGTAREHVVNDYGEKLLAAIVLSQIIMQQSAAYLLFQDRYSIKSQFLVSNQEFQTFESLAIRKFVSFHKHHMIYIYNPTDQRRLEIIKILLHKYQVHVTSDNQTITDCQIDPKWSHRRSNIINENQFELLIQIDIEPYSLKEYTIHADATKKSCPLSKIQYVDEKQIQTNLSTPFKIELIDAKTFEIDNRVFSIIFSKNGAILNVQHKKFDEKLHFHADLISYGTLRESDHHSGAYLFIPDGEARFIPMSDCDFIRIQQGPLVSRVVINHKLYGLQYKLTNTIGSNDNLIHISTITHLDMNKDTELALRLSTGIKNEREFFTDLNGFQMIRRKTYDKLPLQGNVYPMPTMAYIEDDYMRLNILAGQPSGAACLKPGKNSTGCIFVFEVIDSSFAKVTFSSRQAFLQIKVNEHCVVDVFLDRRLTRDDGRGLGQGILDNREVISTFKILFESRHKIVDRTAQTGYPTLLAHHLSIELLYPLHIFNLLASKIFFNELKLFPKPLPFPSDYHLVNLRTLSSNNYNTVQHRPSKNIALILRRFAYNCDENYDNLFHFEQPIFEYFFQVNQIEAIEQTSLSLRYRKQKLNSTAKLDVPFAEIVTYKLRLTE
ncbi:unnamed protein product [Rotaria magnacalcarata]